MDYSHRTTPTWISTLPLDSVFVFGSNLAGRHGRGAAKTAYKKWGATYNKGSGPSGRCYAIPVKDGRRKEDPDVKKTLSLAEIKPFVDDFIIYAKENYNSIFLVVDIGCGLAGYTPAQMAPLFKHVIDFDNIHLPESFWKVLIKSPATK